MRISDWSSDVCSSDLKADRGAAPGDRSDERLARDIAVAQAAELLQRLIEDEARGDDAHRGIRLDDRGVGVEQRRDRLEPHHRSEEHTSELQSLMRISYAVFCLTKKNTHSRESDNTN